MTQEELEDLTTEQWFARRRERYRQWLENPNNAKLYLLHELIDAAHQVAEDLDGSHDADEDHDDGCDACDIAGRQVQSVVGGLALIQFLLNGVGRLPDSFGTDAEVAAKWGRYSTLILAVEALNAHHRAAPAPIVVEQPEASPQ